MAQHYQPARALDIVISEGQGLLFADSGCCCAVKHGPVRSGRTSRARHSRRAVALVAAAERAAGVSARGPSRLVATQPRAAGLPSAAHAHPADKGAESLASMS